MPAIVIVAYRPKDGRDAELSDLIKTHVPMLRRLGLATERAHLALRGKDGVIVEVFEWADGGIEAAHEHPDVKALWEKFAEVCDYVPLKELPEAGDMFAEFEPQNL